VNGALFPSFALVAKVLGKLKAKSQEMEGSSMIDPTTFDLIKKKYGVVGRVGLFGRQKAIRQRATLET
jgi:hypothetical protein